MQMTNDYSMEIRKIRPQEIKEVQDLRYKVLYEPLGLPYEKGVSDSDFNEDKILLGGFLNNKLVTTLRLSQLTSNTWAVRRMATDPSYQRQGLARQLFARAEQEARDRGGQEIILHSRPGAVGFYEKLGFKPTGGLGLYDGMQQPEMVKDL
jgi:GNAT superfamily N-acetyltransferase